MISDPATIEARRAQIMMELGFGGIVKPPAPIHPVEPVEIYEQTTVDGVISLFVDDDDQTDEIPF